MGPSGIKRRRRPYRARAARLAKVLEERHGGLTPEEAAAFAQPRIDQRRREGYVVVDRVWIPGRVGRLSLLVSLFMGLDGRYTPTRPLGTLVMRYRPVGVTAPRRETLPPVRWVDPPDDSDNGHGILAWIGAILVGAFASPVALAVTWGVMGPSPAALLLGAVLGFAAGCAMVVRVLGLRGTGGWLRAGAAVLLGQAGILVAFLLLGA